MAILARKYARTLSEIFLNYLFLFKKIGNMVLCDN